MNGNGLHGEKNGVKHKLKAPGQLWKIFFKDGGEIEDGELKITDNPSSSVRDDMSSPSSQRTNEGKGKGKGKKVSIVNVSRHFREFRFHRLEEGEGKREEMEYGDGERGQGSSVGRRLAAGGDEVLFEREGTGDEEEVEENNGTVEYITSNIFAENNNNRTDDVTPPLRKKGSDGRFLIRTPSDLALVPPSESAGKWTERRMRCCACMRWPIWRSCACLTTLIIIMLGVYAIVIVLIVKGFGL